MARKDISDLQVCLAYAESKRQYREIGAKHQWPTEILAVWTGQSEKVCYRAMERAEQRGYIEWGVSLRSGWLTDKAIDLLNSG